MHTFARLMQAYADRYQLNDQEGSSKTPVPGVHFYRTSRSNGRQPLLYQSGIIFMGQGHKKIYLGNQKHCYGAGDYLVLGVPLPLECQAMTENEKPLLGMTVDVDPQVLNALVNQLPATLSQSAAERNNLDAGLTSQQMPGEMMDACIRLFTVLQNETEAKILGPSIVKEIIYRILISDHGHILFDLARHDGHYARVARILTKLHQSYADNITVESLADEAHMSVSAFHRAFRQVTLETPLQYLKKVRLGKAKDMILFEGKRVNEVANLVGYSSPSQFSREFKRHFNATPKDLAQTP